MTEKEVPKAAVGMYSGQNAGLDMVIGRTTWQEMLAKAQSDPKNQIACRGARLADVADKCGLFARHIIRFEPLLDQADLDPADCTPEVIAFAESLDRRWSDDLRRWTEKQAEANQAKVQAAMGLPVAAKITILPKVFGHNVNAILRWMGAEFWTTREASLVLRKHYLSNATLHPDRLELHMEIGKEKSRIPKLTEGDANTLYDQLAEILDSAEKS